MTPEILKAIAGALVTELRRREVCRELGIHHSRIYRELKRRSEFALWFKELGAASRFERENRIFELHPMPRQSRKTQRVPRRRTLQPRQRSRREDRSRQHYQQA